MELYAIKVDGQYVQYDGSLTRELTLFCLWTNKQLILDSIINGGRGELVSFNLVNINGGLVKSKTIRKKKGSE